MDPITQAIGFILALPFALVFLVISFAMVGGTIWLGVYFTLKIMGREMPPLPPVFNRFKRHAASVRPVNLTVHHAAPYATRNMIILPKEKR